MTLEEAIQHLKESLADPTHEWGCEECKQEHEQLLVWLEDYKQLKDDYTDLDNRLRTANTEIDRLQSESSWIPCNTKLPEVGDMVLVAIANGDIDIAILDKDKTGFSNGFWYNVRNVTHWIPLPETPKSK